VAVQSCLYSIQGRRKRADDLQTFVIFLNGREWGLAMSRGLGDAAAIGELQEMWRTDESSPSFLTAASSSSETDGSCTNTAEAATVDDKDIQLFVVSAADCVIDFFEPTGLARVMAASFYDRATNNPRKAAEDMVHVAAKEWREEMEGEYRDDITISAAKIPLN
jgi:hypothetical protein